MLKLKHLFSNIEGSKVVCYTKDELTEKFYKVTNTGTRRHVMEQIEEISPLEFIGKFQERISEKLNPKKQILGMPTGWIFDPESGEVTFEKEEETPHQKLVEEISKSLNYNAEDADFYAKYLLRTAVEQYNKLPVAYINDDEELIIDRVGFVYKIGDEKRNKRTMQALKLDREKQLITGKEFLEAIKIIGNN
ncbi:hypothetical protein [Clostridium felsineum]|uniref:hypothetical protein n=1 Tax=Clostridium felsineum TaxID=36839 RepID=UPI00214D250A|nr:hypothetical protein [Clostridium felsineum]